METLEELLRALLRTLGALLGYPWSHFHPLSGHSWPPWGHFWSFWADFEESLGSQKPCSRLSESTIFNFGPPSISLCSIISPRKVPEIILEPLQEFLGAFLRTLGALLGIHGVTFAIPGARLASLGSFLKLFWRLRGVAGVAKTMLSLKREHDFQFWPPFDLFM